MASYQPGAPIARFSVRLALCIVLVSVVYALAMWPDYLGW